MVNHQNYMRTAIELARGNPIAPFGAVLVDSASEEIVAEGLNRSKENPTWHGEMMAIEAYAASGRRDWRRLRLYTTAEPCCMCQAAILWSCIPEVVFGTSVARLQALGWRQFDCSAEDVVKLAGFAECQITGGVLADECDALFAQA